MDRRDPVRFREWPALIVRNRNEGGSRKFSNNVAQSRQVEPPVHGSEKRHAQATEERKRQPIDVSMDHVEIFRSLRDASSSRAQAAFGSVPFLPSRSARGHTA